MYFRYSLNSPSLFSSPSSGRITTSPIYMIAIMMVSAFCILLSGCGKAEPPKPIGEPDKSGMRPVDVAVKMFTAANEGNYEEANKYLAKETFDFHDNTYKAKGGISAFWDSRTRNKTIKKMMLKSNEKTKNGALKVVLRVEFAAEGEIVSAHVRLRLVEGLWKEFLK